MKSFIKIIFLFVFTFIFFTGCAQKVNLDNLNSQIFKDFKTYSTYDKKEAKITSYYFSKKGDVTQYRHNITYIPMDATDQLYSFTSGVTMTLKRLTNSKAKTIEDALEMEVTKYNYTKLFKDKEEFIIGNDFARDLKWSIKEFNDMIDRQDNRDSRMYPEVVLPAL